jgi:hypothetical protein
MACRMDGFVKYTIASGDHTPNEIASEPVQNSLNGKSEPSMIGLPTNPSSLDFA